MTKPDSPPPELPRTLAVAQLGAGGLSHTISATTDECAAIAVRLQIPAVGALTCHFHLAAARGGVVVAQGSLSAQVTRDCVVTLEPFEAALREDFRIRFVLAERLADEDDLLDLESDDELPYNGVHIELGEAAVEQLALALDPYPRMPGAELAQDDVLVVGVPAAGAEDASATVSPFAALARRFRQA